MSDNQGVDKEAVHISRKTNKGILNYCIALYYVVAIRRSSSSARLIYVTPQGAQKRLIEILVGSFVSVVPVARGAKAGAPPFD